MHLRHQEARTAKSFDQNLVSQSGNKSVLRRSPTAISSSLSQTISFSLRDHPARDAEAAFSTTHTRFYTSALEATAELRSMVELRFSSAELRRPIGREHDDFG